MRFLNFRVLIQACIFIQSINRVNQSTNQSSIIMHTSIRAQRLRVNFDRIARIRSQKYHGVENRSMARIPLTELDKTWQFLYDKSGLFWSNRVYSINFALNSNITITLLSLNDYVKFLKTFTNRYSKTLTTWTRRYVNLSKRITIIAWKITNAI